MTVEEALKHLGAKRVIWIDDHFAATPQRLGAMIVENIEAALKCDFPELREELARFAFAEEEVRQKTVQILTPLPQRRRDEIRNAMLASESEVEGASIPEMPVEAIDAACELLSVAPADRWTFEGVEARVKATIEQYGGQDDQVTYIVDINDNLSQGTNNRRGVEVLRLLANERSISTAFVLTHETETAKEEGYEHDLVQELDPAGIAPFPFCVVSKERLLPNEPDEQAMAEAFRVAIKRAGLRRSVHEVLRLVGPTVASSLSTAKRNLLRIPPETLDEHVVKRSQEEGESELHVIERALTAHIARDVRRLFGSNEKIRTSVERVRSMREIPLRYEATKPDRDLTDFRDAETWESDVLINSAFSPLACGDVFEVDVNEPTVSRSGKPKRFVLLAQPCDVQLRHSRDRDARTAILAPLKAKEPTTDRGAPEDKLKEIVLPYTLDGKFFVCDLRKTAAVNLAILDLATFRPDGCVRYDKDQKQPKGLLPGQSRVYVERTSWLDGLVSELEIPSMPSPSSKSGPAATGDEDGRIASENREADDSTSEIEAEAKSSLSRSEDGAKAKTNDSDGVTSRRLQLAFASTDEFRHVEVGKTAALWRRKEHGKTSGMPHRVTWCLRRVGRIRMPYAADLLDRYVAVISRNAFDNDFAAPVVAEKLGAARLAAAAPAPKTATSTITPEGA